VVTFTVALTFTVAPPSGSDAVLVSPSLSVSLTVTLSECEKLHELPLTVPPVILPTKEQLQELPGPICPPTSQVAGFPSGTQVVPWTAGFPLCFSLVMSPN